MHDIGREETAALPEHLGEGHSLTPDHGRRDLHDHVQASVERVRDQQPAQHREDGHCQGVACRKRRDAAIENWAGGGLLVCAGFSKVDCVHGRDEKNLFLVH